VHKPALLNLGEWLQLVDNRARLVYVKQQLVLVEEQRLVRVLHLLLVTLELAINLTLAYQLLWSLHVLQALSQHPLQLILLPVKYASWLQYTVSSPAMELSCRRIHHRSRF
jgi:hypothetical protein